MPITPLKLQRRLTEVGRIRIGETKTTSDGKTRPSKLDRFRFTSSDKQLLVQVAELYGGEVVEWVPANGGPTAWEVITDATSIPVVVHPQSITQWFESWSGGGCQRRCDGERMVVADGEPADRDCLCAAQERDVCKPTTRLSVLLTDVESVGVWRLESHGWNAAAELPGMAELLAQAGAYVRARLFLKAVRQVTRGQTRDFMVPALAMDGVTPGELVTRTGRAAALAGGATAVIESGAAAALEAPKGRQWLAEAAAATEFDTVRELYKDAHAAGADTETLAKIKARGDELQATEQATAGGSGEATPPVSESPAEVETVDAELVDDDGDAVWLDILKQANRLGLTTSAVQRGFEDFTKGRPFDDATTAELRAYLADLTARAS